MNKSKIKISIILNILIIIFTIFACVVMFNGIKFMKGTDLVLSESSLGMYRFYTVDSNLLMAIISLIFITYELRLLKGNIKNIPKWIYLLKLIGTVGVTLTFTIVFTYLSSIVDGGIYTLIMNSNLFFHLITPILSIITFIFFENTNKLTLKDSLIGTSSMVLYSIFYLVNVLIHMQNGKVSPDYDWYWFVQNGVWTAIIVVPLIFLITYLISFILWKLNKKID